MVPVEKIATSRLTDRDDIQKMADQARGYLQSHKWCRSIRRGYFDCGVAGILAVFYFEIEPDNADDAVWVIVGDIPPAYIDTESCATGAEALNAYICCMHEWVEAVRAGQPVDDMIPVGYADSGRPMDPTPATDEMLAHRLRTIEAMVVPWLADGTWDEEQNEA
jgi:hypothetical protein